jgi:hypothetical protein
MNGSDEGFGTFIVAVGNGTVLLSFVKKFSIRCRAWYKSLA